MEKLKKQNTFSVRGENELSCTSSKNSLAILEKMNSRPERDLDSQISAISGGIIKETSKMYQEQKVELLFILDKSRSCGGTELATCDSYNQLINKEKKAGFPTKVSSVLFDGTINEISFRTDIEKIKPLTYTADGKATAIYDAIGSSINKILNLQKEEIHPAKKTLVAIMTDGVDNSSHVYTQNSTRELIEYAKSKGWEFIFLGASKKSCKEGLTLGIPTENIALISMSEQGMNSNFNAIEEAITSVRETGKVNSSWKDGIQRDDIEKLGIEDKEVQRTKRLEMH